MIMVKFFNLKKRVLKIIFSDFTMKTLKNPSFCGNWNYMNKLLSSLIVLFFINSSLLAEECLIMKGDDVDPEEFSELMGKKILFCCGSCVKAFDGAPAYYIKAIPGLAKMFSEEEKKKLGVEKVKLLEQKFCPIYPDRFINPNSKTVEHKGKTIYLWSSSAQRRWKRDPDAYFKEAFDKGLLPQFKS
jgi:YHS domain-containing protein|tara:strand:- start:9 stop:569 length:561 start_codon:yes stop_codon:yes gene_type:complete